MAPTNSDIQYQLGVLTARVTTLEKTQGQLLETMEAMRKEMQTINSTLSEAKGGWRVLMMVGGFGTVLGGMIAFGVNTWLKIRGGA